MAMPILLEPGRDLGQQRIAGGVPERVIDVLEAVEIEAEHRHQVAVPLGARHRAVEMLVKLKAVGQAGEAIMHGEIANLILGEPTLADAPRGDGRRHREAHDDQQARSQGDHGEGEIGERGSGRLVDGKGVDAGDLAIFRCRDEGETEIAVAGYSGGHHPVLRDGLSDRRLDVTLREHALKRGGEITAGGERRLVGSEHGETVELAHEFALGLGELAQEPAGGQAAEILEQGEIVFGGRAGRQARRLAGLAGELIGVEHLEALVEKLRSVRSQLAQAPVDVAGPAQRGFARISGQNIVDG
jgi:hypothetical protein